ncbi:SLC13 family permease [Desulfococcaceae bacterium HSG8]|nr:SLC13 family permease [Desulfococcaceae bacterium HSG8]
MYYLWTRLPLILLFLNGYVIYRVLVVTKLTDVFVLRGLQKSRGSLNRLCLYIIVVSAVLSFFIPNAITVLIMLPVLKTVEQDIALKTSEYSITTALTLSVIYGANIGGMGSLIGSPANLLLIGALDLYQVPGREQISFLNWFIWSVPLVAGFLAAAYLIVSCQLPVVSGQLPVATDNGQRTTDNRQILAGRVFIFFLAFWIIESVLKELIPGFGPLEPPLCILFFIFFLHLVFIRPLGRYHGPLLCLTDIFTGFPKRGILFLCLLGVIISLVRIFQIDKWASVLLSDALRAEMSVSAIIFTIIIAVIFLTELLSNTVVSTAFFSISYFIAVDHSIHPLILMIAVSAASTCAFMTPIATPCNALAFGEMKGTSFPRMLISGFLLNIIGAGLMTLWLQFVIPIVY